MTDAEAEYRHICTMHGYKAAQEWRREHNRRCLKALMESPDADYGELSEAMEGSVVEVAKFNSLGKMDGLRVTLRPRESGWSNGELRS